MNDLFIFVFGTIVTALCLGPFVVALFKDLDS